MPATTIITIIMRNQFFMLMEITSILMQVEILTINTLLENQFWVMMVMNLKLKCSNLWLIKYQLMPLQLRLL